MYSLAVNSSIQGSFKPTSHKTFGTKKAKNYSSNYSIKSRSHFGHFDGNRLDSNSLAVTDLTKKFQNKKGFLTGTRMPSCNKPMLLSQRRNYNKTISNTLNDRPISSAKTTKAPFKSIFSSKETPLLRLDFKDVKALGGM